MINLSKLLRELAAAGIAADAADITGTYMVGNWNAYPHGTDVVRVDYLTAPTQAQVTTAKAVVAAHDPTDIDAVNLSDVQARWAASALHNKTPAQIYTAMQGQIDGWTSLANAKADLRIWLPILFAGIAWTQFKDQQRD